MTKNYHVTQRPDGDWQYKQPGADRASGTAQTQGKAEQAAKDAAHRAGGGEVTIHRPLSQGSTIRDRDTVAPKRDPFPPRDSKH